MSGSGSSSELSNWGRWGADDELGTLNYLTPERVLRATAEVRLGEQHVLNLPMSRPTYSTRPTLVKQSLMLNEHREHGIVMNDDQVTFATQGSTQWDAFAHVGLLENGPDEVFYNGIPLAAVDEHGFAHRGAIEAVAWRGIVGRGVLVDVARFVADGGDEPLALGHRIGAAEVRRCLEAQGTTIEPGDIVCFRTGFSERILELSPEEGAALMVRESLHVHGNPGITSELAAVAHEQQWAAATADNVGVEAIPFEDNDMSKSLHVKMLRNLGLPLGEFFLFDSLSRACARDGRWKFLFVSAPLRIPGGVGSPANAIALR